jgi:hypothetical protein
MQDNGYCNLDADFLYRLERVRNEFLATLVLISLKKNGAGNGARTRGKNTGMVVFRSRVLTRNRLRD